MTICSLIDDYSQVSQHCSPKFNKSFTLWHNAPFHRATSFLNDTSLQQKKAKFSQGLLAGNKAYKTVISWISASTFYFVLLYRAYSLSSWGSRNCTTSVQDTSPKPATSLHALVCIHVPGPRSLLPFLIFLHPLHLTFSILPLGFYFIVTKAWTFTKINKTAPYNC